MTDNLDMTPEEAINAIAETAKAKLKNIIADEEKEINLKVATIAGWENIDLWRDGSKVLVGTNAMRPELGKFVPVYTKDLGAIFKEVAHHTKPIGASFGVQFLPNPFYSPVDQPYLAYGYGLTFYEASPALALCKLLLAIASEPNQVSSSVE